MPVDGVKALTDCLVTAQEAQEFLAEGKGAATKPGSMNAASCRPGRLRPMLYN